jgi:hypothetical protein
MRIPHRIIKSGDIALRTPSIPTQIPALIASFSKEVSDRPRSESEMNEATPMFCAPKCHV